MEGGAPQADFLRGSYWPESKRSVPPVASPVHTGPTARVHGKWVDWVLSIGNIRPNDLGILGSTLIAIETAVEQSIRLGTSTL